MPLRMYRRNVFFSGVILGNLRTIIRVVHRVSVFYQQMSAYDELQAGLRAAPRTWLVTGVAGFIGSNLLEQLLRLDQRVVGLDNFATGFKKNLDEVRALVTPEQWGRFQFIEGDICDAAMSRRACEKVEMVLHQAGINSAPRSIDDPIGCHRINVTGFVTLYLAARDAGVKRFVYASSSTVYGDDPRLPKVEENIGRPLSPYGATKQMAEQYADIYARTYGFPSIGLRYFNVFGARQTSEGGYAAVIPAWIAAMLQSRPIYINGDGETSRDFCYIQNVVQANLLAATVTKPEAVNQVYNVAVGERTTLNELFELLQQGLRRRDASLPEVKPVCRDFRAGDVRHSLADISKAKRLLGYAPTQSIREGLELAMDWYRRKAV
jgi:UDP-N-acetylglucosamine/UDP-N-acetylgalactosamine 4-epimerase